MPNTLAYIMLAIWPLVTLTLFRKLGAPKALIWAILAAYLILPPLPAAFDLPLLPPFNKDTISHLSVLFVVMFALGTSSDKVKRGLTMPESGLGKFLVVVFVLSPIATVLTNPEPLIFQHSALRGLGGQDLIALPVTQLLILIGFLLARQYLQSAETLRFILWSLMVAGLAYSLPVLLEIRLSPQLNTWIYGYFQHSFEQMMRGGGFRAIVFLNHGIWVAFFVMISAVSAFALWRADSGKSGPLFLVAALYLGVVLFLSKTLGPLLFALLLVPVLMLFGAKNQIKIAALLALMAFAYPVLKGVGLVPTQMMLQQAERVDPERAGSLQFRFMNEDLLFDRVAEKPAFGWGSWGRNHLHDPVTGEITSTSDGRWVIVFGIFGWVGFIAEFGLLVLPILLIWRESRLLRHDQVSPYVGPLSLILAVNLIDLIPNATLTPLTWLIGGALLGHSEVLRRVRLGQTGETLPAVIQAKRRTII